MVDFFLFLAIAAALGFKHAYDADHLVAVTAVITRVPKDTKRVLWLGLAWASGHMITAAVITTLLFLSTKAAALDLSWLEKGVAVMLIVIGAVALAFEHPKVRGWWKSRVHRHSHDHAGEKHEHHHAHLRRRYGEHGLMVGIGFLHGLASNDELLILLLPVLTVTSLGVLLSGVLFFSLGVVVGMTIFAWVVTYPMRRWDADKVRSVIAVSVAVLSIVYGVALLAGYQGFNPFP